MRGANDYRTRCVECDRCQAERMGGASGWVEVRLEGTGAWLCPGCVGVAHVEIPVMIEGMRAALRVLVEAAEKVDKARGHGAGLCGAISGARAALRQVERVVSVIRERRVGRGAARVARKNAPRSVRTKNRGEKNK